jgi:SAM-dependent methyltransferase
MSKDTNTTVQFWSEHVKQLADGNSGLFWWDAGPDLFEYRNVSVSGDPQTNWTRYTLKKYFDGKLPLARCLSLGCGGGRLERHLAELGTFQQCDAYDITAGAIELARDLAHEDGFNNITYKLANINTLTLPPNWYDAVWISMAMHHFEELEHVCQQIGSTLKPEGLLILEEYVGPNRFQFPEYQKEVSNLCLSLLPARYRVRDERAADRELRLPPKGAKWFTARFIDKLKDGDLLGAMQRRLSTYRARRGGQLPEKRTINFPTVSDVVAADPTEAIRSEEIVAVLQDYFKIVEKKALGGNLLQFLLADIAGNFPQGDQQARDFLRMLISIEETFLSCGEFESDFAYIVARPKI